MEPDVLSSKLKFTTPDDDVYEGEIPEQRWWGPRYTLMDLGVIDTGIHSRSRGDYRIDFDVRVPLEELKEHECTDTYKVNYLLHSSGALACICAPDELWNYCVNKRRVFFRTIMTDIHASLYFADCMNRNKTVGIPFLPPLVMNNICRFFSLFPDGISWLDVHDKHAGVFRDQAAKCSVKYQNFLAVEIDFSEELFEECEDISDYMYPDCMIESEVMIRIEGYVIHD